MLIGWKPVDNKELLKSRKVTTLCDLLCLLGVCRNSPADRAHKKPNPPTELSIPNFANSFLTQICL